MELHLGTVRYATLTCPTCCKVLDSVLLLCPLCRWSVVEIDSSSQSYQSVNRDIHPVSGMFIYCTCLYVCDTMCCAVLANTHCIDILVSAVV